MAKTRINLSLDLDLAEFAKVLAEENRTTVADIFTQYLLALKRSKAGEPADIILSDPAFREAMEDVQRRLRSGKVKWHSFDEVFS